MLAQNYLLQTAYIARISLHELDKAISDFIPLPVNHHIQNACKSDSLSAKSHAFCHV